MLNHVLKQLKINKTKLTKQQFRTLKGQALSGDAVGAYKGLIKLLHNREMTI